MIFPIAFIATLFLPQIARAVPQACYYPTSPEPSTPEEQFRITAPLFTAKYDPDYNSPTGSVGDVACSELASQFPDFFNVPFFPDVGGAFNTTKDSSHCGAIWTLTNNANQVSTHFISIDTTVGSDFGLPFHTFSTLGGNPGAGSLTVKAEIVGHLGVCK